MLDRKVYDYKTVLAWFPAIFFLVWGWFPLIGGSCGLLYGAVKDPSGVMWPKWTAVPFVIIGLIAIVGAALLIVRIINEKIVLSEDEVVYIDWLGRQTTRCPLKDVRLDPQVRYEARPWFGIAPGHRAVHMTYRVETPSGRFAFNDSIRNKDELIRRLRELGSTH